MIENQIFIVIFNLSFLQTTENFLEEQPLTADSESFSMLFLTIWVYFFKVT